MTDNPEPLAVLLLPRRVEEFELAAHAQDLLAIPRVVALEPSRARTRRLRRNTITALQARRLRFPGRPRVFVLYEPEQYPLARAARDRRPGGAVVREAGSGGRADRL